MCKCIRRLICLGTIAAIVYLGVLFGRPYYKYYAFKSDAEEIVRFADVEERQMKEHFMKRAKDIGVPLKEENLELTKVNDGYKAKVSWSETVKVYEYKKQKKEKKFDFAFEVGG